MYRIRSCPGGLKESMYNPRYSEVEVIEVIVNYRGINILSIPGKMLSNRVEDKTMGSIIIVDIILYSLWNNR